MRKYLIAISTVLVLALLLLVTANLSVEKTENNSVENNIVWALYTDIFTNGGIIVYGTGNQKFTESYIDLALKLKSSFRLKNIKIEPDKSIQLSFQDFHYCIFLRVHLRVVLIGLPTQLIGQQ